MEPILPEINEMRRLEQAILALLHDQKPPRDPGVALAALVGALAAVLVWSAEDDDAMLDGIRVINDSLRATATDLWVEQRIHLSAP